MSDLGYTPETDYKRTGRILSKKMNALLFPSILAAAATSLNEFVDSILMSNLLGSDALAVINYCFCIMLVYATIHVLIGYGGMIVYSRYAGDKQTKKAEEIFSGSFWLIVVVSIIVLIAGVLFKNGIAPLLCTNQSLLGDLETYLLPLFLSAPLVIIINALSYFLPVFGKPNLAMALVIIANAVNLVMDYVYVKFFGMGVEGAAWATLTGYVVSAIFIIILILMKKCRLALHFKFFGSLKDLGSVLIAGLPTAIFQICFAVQSIYFNHTSEALGGKPAYVALSLQTQIQSIVSVVLGGIADTMTRFVAILHAQGDRVGIKYVVKRSIIILCVFTIAFFVLLQIWPQCILFIYGVNEADVSAIALPAIRIFAATYIFRGITILLRNYMNACGYNYYSTGISIWDSLVGLLIWSAILIPIFGLTGLWLAFPVNALVLLIIVIVINIIHSKRHENCDGILMFKSDPNCLAFINITIEDKTEVIADVSEKVQTFCNENNVEKSKGYAAGLLTEEMCVYVANQNKENLFIDITIRIFKEKVQIDFRNLGTPSNPLLDVKNENSENIKILQGLSSKLEYDYSLGINSTKVTILQDAN